MTGKGKAPAPSQGSTQSDDSGGSIGQRARHALSDSFVEKLDKWHPIMSRRNSDASDHLTKAVDKTENNDNDYAAELHAKRTPTPEASGSRPTPSLIDLIKKMKPASKKRPGDQSAGGADGRPAKLHKEQPSARREQERKRLAEEQRQLAKEKRQRLARIAQQERGRRARSRIKDQMRNADPNTAHNVQFCQNLAEELRMLSGGHSFTTYACGWGKDSNGHDVWVASSSKPNGQMGQELKDRLGDLGVIHSQHGGEGMHAEIRIMQHMKDHNITCLGMGPSNYPCNNTTKDDVESDGGCEKVMGDCNISIQAPPSPYRRNVPITKLNPYAEGI